MPLEPILSIPLSDSGYPLIHVERKHTGGYCSEASLISANLIRVLITIFGVLVIFHTFWSLIYHPDGSRYILEVPNLRLAEFSGCVWPTVGLYLRTQPCNFESIIPTPWIWRWQDSWVCKSLIRHARYGWLTYCTTDNPSDCILPFIYFTGANESLRTIQVHH